MLHPLCGGMPGVVAPRHSLQALALHDDAVFAHYIVKLLVVIHDMLAQPRQVFWLPRPRAALDKAALVADMQIVAQREKTLLMRRKIGSEGGVIRLLAPAVAHIARYAVHENFRVFKYKALAYRRRLLRDDEFHDVQKHEKILPRFLVLLMVIVEPCAVVVPAQGLRVGQHAVKIH